MNTNLSARLKRLEALQPGGDTEGVLMLPSDGTEDQVAVREAWDHFTATGRATSPVVIIPADEPNAEHLSGKRIHTRINFWHDANWYRNWDRLHPGTEPPPPEYAGWMGLDRDNKPVIDQFCDEFEAS